MSAAATTNNKTQEPSRRTQLIETAHLMRSCPNPMHGPMPLGSDAAIVTYLRSQTFQVGDNVGVFLHSTERLVWRGRVVMNDVFCNNQPVFLVEILGHGFAASSQSTWPPNIIETKHVVHACNLLPVALL